LFQVACCRRGWHLLHDERSRRAVEDAEWYADGCLTDEELERSYIDARNAEDQAHSESYSEEARSNFCDTPAYDATCMAQLAAAAARIVAERGLCARSYWSPAAEWAHKDVASALATEQTRTAVLNWKGAANHLWRLREEQERTAEANERA